MRITSRNGIPIRLEDERWAHIVEEHSELAGLRIEVLETVSEATRVLRGAFEELLAVRMIDHQKALVVVYREVSGSDGFIITAFVTKRLASLERREVVWPQQW